MDKMDDNIGSVKRPAKMRIYNLVAALDQSLWEEDYQN
jgi:hypothetical protein